MYIFLISKSVFKKAFPKHVAVNFHSILHILNIHLFDSPFGRYGYHISRNSYFLCYDQTTIKNLFDNLRNYNGDSGYPKLCGKFQLTGVRDLTTGFDDNQPDNKAVSLQCV